MKSATAMLMLKCVPLAIVPDPPDAFYLHRIVQIEDHPFHRMYRHHQCLDIGTYRLFIGQHLDIDLEKGNVEDSLLRVEYPSACRSTGSMLALRTTGRIEQK
jgi:hypothetical protein